VRRRKKEKERERKEKERIKEQSTNRILNIKSPPIREHLCKTANPSVDRI
jgi:hypothetical protein